MSYYCLSLYIAHTFSSHYVFLPCIITGFSRPSRYSHIDLPVRVSFFLIHFDGIPSGITSRVTRERWSENFGQNVAEGYLRFGFLSGYQRGHQWAGGNVHVGRRLPARDPHPSRLLPVHRRVHVSSPVLRGCLAVSDPTNAMYHPRHL